MTPRRATSLRPGQYKHLIRVASVTGRLPERDVMLLWLTHTTGIRVAELALLVSKRCHQARGVLASGHHEGLQATKHLPHPCQMSYRARCVV